MNYQTICRDWTRNRRAARGVDSVNAFQMDFSRLCPRSGFLYYFAWNAVSPGCVLGDFDLIRERVIFSRTVARDQELGWVIELNNQDYVFFLYDRFPPWMHPPWKAVLRLPHLLRAGLLGWKSNQVAKEFTLQFDNRSHPFSIAERMTNVKLHSGATRQLKRIYAQCPESPDAIYRWLAGIFNLQSIQEKQGQTSGFTILIETGKPGRSYLLRPDLHTYAQYARCGT